MCGAFFFQEVSKEHARQKKTIATVLAVNEYARTRTQKRLNIPAVKTQLMKVAAQQPAQSRQLLAKTQSYDTLKRAAYVISAVEFYPARIST